jgi:hypothetical protein
LCVNVCVFGFIYFFCLFILFYLFIYLLRMESQLKYVEVAANNIERVLKLFFDKKKQIKYYLFRFEQSDPIKTIVFVD